MHQIAAGESPAPFAIDAAAAEREGCAPRLRGADAAVDGRAAAEAENNFSHAQAGGFSEQLAGAVRGGSGGIALIALEQLQAAGGRHFDDGGEVVAVFG